MMENPLVSVGIPCYNRPEGLRRTLECITGQTYKSLEIIVSDNCSPDPEVERVGREFAEKDPRVRYFCHDKNNGMSYNLWYTVKESTGHYFMWACDDDIFDKKFIKMCLDKIGENGCCATNNVNVDEQGKIFKKYIIPTVTYGNSYYEDIIKFIPMISAGYFYSLYQRDALAEFYNSLGSYPKYNDTIDFNGICEVLIFFMQLHYGISTIQEDLFFKQESTDHKRCKSYERFDGRDRDIITYNLKILQYINDSTQLQYYEKVNIVTTLITTRFLPDIINQRLPKRVARYIIYLLSYLPRYIIKKQKTNRIIMEN